jgi:septum formation protein
MQRQSQKRSLVLASSSPYRKALLERFGIPFAVRVPEVDEAPRPGEPPSTLVERLAQAKAGAVAAHAPAAVVIGSDQVAVHDGRVMGKPGDPQRARRQLAAFSGRRVDFLTAFSVQCIELDYQVTVTIPTEVCFRDLSAAEIQRYVARDNPVDCAGAFKSEATGATLLREMRSGDPTAIVGLPLISLAEALRGAGFRIP